jgi:hypothetical protein
MPTFSSPSAWGTWFCLGILETMLIFFHHINLCCLLKCISPIFVSNAAIWQTCNLWYLSLFSSQATATRYCSAITATCEICSSLYTLIKTRQNTVHHFH